MASSIRSSFLLYEGTQEWQLSDPRNCFEIGHVGTVKFSKTSREVEFTVPLSNDKISSPIYWNLQLFTSGNLVDNKPTVDIYVCTNTKSCAIGKQIGVKASIAILDDSCNILAENRGYAGLGSSSATSALVLNWRTKLEDIPFNCPFIKICCTYQAYDFDPAIIAAQTDPAQISTPSKDTEGELAKELAHVLDKDRQTGTSTDAVLKLGQTEYKVHKCVLSLQSDFFKARFSERWEARDTDTRVVDMNDSELSPELLEALICGAYTGKVEDLDTAVKVLPVADKYQFHTLKGICEHLISNRLSKDNVLDMHLLANQCGALNILEKCKVWVQR